MNPVLCGDIVALNKYTNKSRHLGFKIFFDVNKSIN